MKILSLIQQGMPDPCPVSRSLLEPFFARKAETTKDADLKHISQPKAIPLL